MSEKLTDFEWDCLMDALDTEREAMEDDGDECFIPHLAALETIEQKIRAALR